MLLSSLFAELTAAAAQQPALVPATKDATPSIAATVTGVRVPFVGLSESVDTAAAISSQQWTDECSRVDFDRLPSPELIAQRVWPPQRSAHCDIRVSAECFQLPAAPSPFILTATASPHSAALTGLLDCVHSSAWSGAWQWSSVDGSLHSYQHIPQGWSSARHAPRAVRPLSQWSQFHTGSTQRGIHDPLSSGAAQSRQRQSAMRKAGQRATGAALEADSLFPFDLPAAAAAERRADLLTVAPLIEVEVSAVASAAALTATTPSKGREQSVETESDGRQQPSQPTGIAAPYRVQSEPYEHSTNNKRDSHKAAAEGADGEVRHAVKHPFSNHPSINPLNHSLSCQLPIDFAQCPSSDCGWLRCLCLRVWCCVSHVLRR